LSSATKPSTDTEPYMTTLPTGLSSALREPSERSELVAEVGLVEVACATGEVAPVDRSGGVDREHGGGEAVGAGRPLRRDADELLDAARMSDQARFAP
jgi:hypothetical protein